MRNCSPLDSEQLDLTCLLAGHGVDAADNCVRFVDFSRFELTYELVE
jgi:hypothetical protein